MQIFGTHEASEIFQKAKHLLCYIKIDLEHISNTKHGNRTFRYAIIQCDVIMLLHLFVILLFWILRFVDKPSKFIIDKMYVAKTFLKQIA